MTVSILQDELCKELEAIFSNQKFKTPMGEKNIKAYKQYLPLNGEDEEREDNEELHPYIVVRVVDGNSEISKSECNILLIIGIYDNDRKMQGYKMLLNIINDIQSRFIENPVLAEQFVANQKIIWTLQEEDADETWPYFYGGMYLNFETAGVGRGWNDYT